MKRSEMISKLEELFEKETIIDAGDRNMIANFVIKLVENNGMRPPVSRTPAGGFGLSFSDTVKCFVWDSEDDNRDLIDKRVDR